MRQGGSGGVPRAPVLAAQEAEEPIHEHHAALVRVVLDDLHGRQEQEATFLSIRLLKTLKFRPAGVT